MNGSRRVVAIVDDDASVCLAIRRLVLSLGHDAVSFPSGETLLSGIGTAQPTHILLDLHMPGLHGPALLKQIRRQAGQTRTLVMTGRDTPGAHDDCLAAGADAYVTKPLPLAVLQRFLDLDAKHAG